VLNLVLGLLSTSRRRLKPSEEEREIFKPLLSLSRPHTVLAFVLGLLSTCVELTNLDPAKKEERDFQASFIFITA
jgi:hypothetical protein